MIVALVLLVVSWGSFIGGFICGSRSRDQRTDIADSVVSRVQERVGIKENPGLTHALTASQKREKGTIIEETKKAMTESLEKLLSEPLKL